MKKKIPKICILGIDTENYISIIKLVRYRNLYHIGGDNMNYKKLKLKIKEVYDTQEAFAKAMDMNKTSLNQRLNGSVEWKMSEVAEAINLLHIAPDEVYLYFFIQKVQIS